MPQQQSIESDEPLPRPSVLTIIARAFLIGGLLGFLVTLLYLALR